MPGSPQVAPCELSHVASRAVLQQIEELEQWWRGQRAAAVVPWNDLALRLRDLRQSLAAEFVDAEATAEAASRALGGSEQPLQKLISNHAVLLAEIDQLIVRLIACEQGIDSWSDSECALTKLLGRLRQAT